MNEAEVIKILNRMHAWTSAHSDGNGERTEAQMRNNINTAFWEKIMPPGDNVIGLEKTYVVQQALIEGENSGTHKRFAPDAYMKRMTKDV